MFAAIRQGAGKFLRRFAKSRRGGIAVWFGLALPFIAVGSLGVIDYGAASMNKESLQDALDDAALVASRSTATTSAQIDVVGDAAFAAVMPANTNLSGLTPNSTGSITNVNFALSGTTVIASASATYTPIVSQLLLGGPITVHANSHVERGMNKLEIAMVLDTTGSMQGTKLSNLITAAKSFITQMETVSNASVVANSVKISIVPFAMTVHVSSPVTMTTYNTATHTMTGLPTWLDGRAQALSCTNDIFTVATCTAAGRPDRFTMLKQMGKTWDGCIEARVAPYDIRDDAPDSTNVNTLFIPYFWPDEPDTNSDYYNDYLNDISSSGTWSVRQGYNAKYTSSNIKASGNISSLGYNYGPNAGCEMQTVMRLSTNFSALRTQVDGLVAGGDTDVPLGLMWGWHTISPNAPFADGSAYSTPHLTKIIVLMTDGDNTYGDANSNNNNNSLYEGYGYIWQNKLGTTSNSSALGKMNERMVPATGTTNEALCNNIKAKSIQIYSIGVGVSTQAKTLLQACATDADHYYDVNSTASNLNAAFTAIAASIQALRISQ